MKNMNWDFPKFGVEKHRIFIDLMTKNHPNLVQHLGEKSKTSSTRNFAAKSSSSL
jgi:hypothetical protein